MTTTPRRGTGRSADYAQSDAYWLKSWFQDQGLLPNTKIFEDLSTYRAPDFSVLNGASAPTRLRSRAKFTMSASTPATYGWDLGASYGKVLFIAGMTRNPGVIAGASLFTFIGKTLPATTLPKEAYFFGSESSSDRVAIYKSDATPTATLLASDAAVSPEGIAAPDCALGLYVDAVNHVQIAVMKMGGSVWWCPIADQADNSIDGAVLRYVGFNFAGALVVYWTGCPIIAYAQ